MASAFISLGCNRGDCRANLAWAIKRLDANGPVEVVSLSSIYQTEPVGEIEQEDFLNMVTGLETSLTPRELLDACREIEEELGGREGRVPKGPRTIDLDILLYDQLHIIEKDLRLPHPEMLKRAFVLMPLAEIAPEMELPQGGTVADALKALTSGHGVERVGKLF